MNLGSDAVEKFAKNRKWNNGNETRNKPGWGRTWANSGLRSRRARFLLGRAIPQELSVNLASPHKKQTTVHLGGREESSLAVYVLLEIWGDNELAGNERSRHPDYVILGCRRTTIV